ncbi:hypothetical protein [Legionella sp. 31fI33]|uniref:hypothetical protein n=1 Tax=Legionella sp. 31fI33 TaxID=2886376 RepID=UPI001E4FFE97|nr:hypothetical protein [Legionella sp. 31fI33]MCC5015800.1 hypothetical protein [Legionella sp. 31fI33]
MPNVKKIVGNSREINTKQVIPVDFLQPTPYRSNTQQLLKDIERARFVPTNGKTVDDFITDASNPDELHYTQGSLTGALFSTPLLQFFIMLNPKFVNEEKGRTEENRIETYYKNRETYQFTYYDDEGVLCGLAIEYSTVDPSLWAASIVRNTNGAAEDNEVLIITPEDLTDKEGEVLESSETATTFLDSIGSEHAKGLLAGIFRDNGDVDTQKLQVLKETLDTHNSVSSNNKVFKAKMKETDALQNAQEVAIEKLKIGFGRAKALIEQDEADDKDARLKALQEKRDKHINLVENAKNEEEIAQAIDPQITGVELPRTGLELLEDTLRSDTENTKALGRVLLAIKSGTLTVNGQAPDEDYPIGEYLTHGGRINFDVSALSAEEQQQFYAFITNNQAKPRAFATHRAGGTDANGSPAEAKSGLLGAISDAFRALVGASKHAGINLAIGGNHIASREGAPGSLGQHPDESGEWGHMYLHQDSNIVMVGIEASAPGKHNVRTGESHSKTGAAGELSPFLQKKIDSRELQQEQVKAGKKPLSTKEKYNWATVKISSDQLRQMMLADQGADYAALVKAKPDNAQPAEPNRKEKMEAWAKATKEGNKTSMAAKIFGFLLFAAGIVLAFAPIPVVSQAVGGWLAGLGLGVATGTVTLGAGLTAAAVGLGVFGLGTRQDPEKPHALYEKNLSKLPPVEVVEKPVVVQEQVVHDVVQEHVVHDVVHEHVVVDVVHEHVVVDDSQLDDSQQSNSSDSLPELDGFKEIEVDLGLVVKSKDQVLDEARRAIDGVHESNPVHSPVVVTKKDVVNPTNTDETTLTF